LDGTKPKVKSVKISNVGLLTIKFNKLMKFDKEWIADINKSQYDGRAEKKTFFSLKYKSGYGPSQTKSGLRKWEVTTAKEDLM
jgi:hypothetical protein